jgi:biotin operon repressor
MPFPQFAQMSAEEDRKAAELYEFGLSQPEVARRIGRSRNAVRQALRRMGIQVRTAKQGQREWLDRPRVKVNRKPVRSVFELAHV